MATKRRYKRRIYRKKKRTQKRRVRGGVVNSIYNLTSTPLGKSQQLMTQEAREKKALQNPTRETDCEFRTKEQNTNCTSNPSSDLCKASKKIVAKVCTNHK